MTQPGHRIIIFCDGTGNSKYNARADHKFTNVSRIQRYIKGETVDGSRQSPHYVKGIGTEGFFQDLLHQANAKGIEDRIKEAYMHICNDYLHESDQIILIGFSRGAFIMRCVADLVSRIGLLTKLGLQYENDVFDAWKDGGDKTYPRDKSDPVYLELKIPTTDDGPASVKEMGAKSWDDVDLNNKQAVFQQLLQDPTRLRRDARIAVCALWDTVAAIDVPLLGIQKTRVPKKFSFVNSELTEEIEYAIQALSLHERRRAWLPLVWRVSGDSLLQKSQRLRQCWFAGYHSDIGGGRKSQGLSHISLAWMIARLQNFLEFEHQNFCNPPPANSSWGFHKEQDDDDLPSGAIKAYESMKWYYRLAGQEHREPRRQFWTTTDFEHIQTPDGDTMRSKETIHWTVRVLKNLSAYPPCKALESSYTTHKDPRGTKCRCERGDKRHIWHWKLSIGTPGKVQNYRVCEEKAREDPRSGVDEDLELKLLEAWLNSELKSFQKTHASEDASIAVTCINEVRAAIRRAFSSECPPVTIQHEHAGEAANVSLASGSQDT